MHPPCGRFKAISSRAFRRWPKLPGSVGQAIRSSTGEASGVICRYRRGVGSAWGTVRAITGPHAFRRAGLGCVRA